MSVKKNFLVIAIGAILLLFSFPEKAQAQDPEFTQFYANPLYLNPAFAGSARCPRVAMNYRNQWPALSGSYVTTSASYDQHVDPISGGLGLQVLHDNAGQGTLTTTQISGIYSYQRALTRTFSLKAGFQATYFQKALDWSKLTFGDQIHSHRGFIYDTQDFVRGGKVTNVDFSFGLLGFSERYFVGAAVHHLTEPNETLIKGNSRLPMKFTGHAGAKIPIDRGSRFSDASISPNILFRHQGEFTQLNLGLYVRKGPIVGGIWYRFNDSFIGLVGIETDIIRFGYSYDVTVSELTPGSGGSHEISLTVQFDCRPKRRKLRTISCPSF